jgi:ribosomal protein S18 acetylase RimI-like enzyme
MLDNIFLPEGFTLRAAKIEDQSFSEALFCSTREYLYLMPLPKPQVDLLVKQQFVLQQSAYALRFPQAVNSIVELNDEPIGKLTLNQSEHELHIVDIVLAQKYRNKGYGTSILSAIQLLTKKRRAQLKLAVDQQNIRAKQLYLALGFNITESSDTHDTMIWLPHYP